MNHKFSILVIGCVGVSVVIFWMDRTAFESGQVVIERTELSPDSGDHFVYHFRLVNEARHPPMTGFVECEFGFDNFLGRKIDNADIDNLKGVEISVKYRPK